MTNEHLNFSISLASRISLWDIASDGEIHIKTIIATAKIGDSRAVRDYARLIGARNPSKLRMVKISQPSGIGTILRSGWMILAGGENERQASDIKLYFLRRLYTSGFRLRCRNYRIRRFLGVFKVPYKISLKKLARRRGFSWYFEGSTRFVQFHEPTKEIDVWIKKDGKAAITGAKSRSNLQFAKSKVMRHLYCCRRM